MKEVILTEEQLQQKLKEWQKRLRLQDWIIKVRLARALELPENSMGCVHVVLPKKMAIIKVLDPIDYDSSLMLPQDMEDTLVHELLHLHLEPILHGIDDSKHIEVEQAIESISFGLVTALRESGGKKE
jgi:hypothetical protein